MHSTCYHSTPAASPVLPKTGPCVHRGGTLGSLQLGEYSPQDPMVRRIPAITDAPGPDPPNICMAHKIHLDAETRCVQGGGQTLVTTIAFFRMFHRVSGLPLALPRLLFAVEFRVVQALAKEPTPPPMSSMANRAVDTHNTHALRHRVQVDMEAHHRARCTPACEGMGRNPRQTTATPQAKVYPQAPRPSFSRPEARALVTLRTFLRHQSCGQQNRG